MLDKPIFNNAEADQSNLELIDLTNLGNQDFIEIAQEEFIFSAQYDREGHDLVMTGADGQTVIVEGYFLTPVPLDLVAADGAKLRGDIVKVLAGPDARGEYAQQGDIQGASPIGQVETLEGTATVQRTDGTVEELQIGTKVFQNDVVITADGSTLSITFADKTIFTLSASSRMVLSELVYAPNGDDNSAVFNLVQGSFVFIAGQVAKTGDMKVETPVATMGIRGTTVSVEIVTDASGQATVTVSLNRDIDGAIGAIELINNLDGSVTQITATSSSWVITPADGITTEIPRTVDDQASDVIIINEAFNAVRSLEAREAAGEQPVNLDEVGSDEGTPQTDGDNNDDTGDDSGDQGDDQTDDDTPGDQSNLGSGLGSGGPTDVTDVDSTGETQISELGEGSVTDPLDDSGIDSIPDLDLGQNEGEDEAPADENIDDLVLVVDPTPVPDPITAPSIDLVFDMTSIDEDTTTTISVANFDSGGSNNLTVTLTAGSTIRLFDDSGVNILSGSDEVLDENGQPTGEYNFLIISGTADGILNALNGATYRPTFNADDTGSLTVTISNEAGDNTLTPDLNQVTINPINDAPTLDSVSTSFDEASPSFDIDLSQFSDDVDGDVLAYSTPNIDSEFFTNGLSIAGSTLTFDPGTEFDFLQAGQTVNRSFTLRAEDPDGLFADNTVTFTITGVNDAPVAQTDTNSGDEDNNISGQLIATDIDTNDNLTFSIEPGAASQPQNGVVIIQSDGSYTFTPNADFNGNDRFTYQVSDGNGGVDTATIDLTINPVNDAPTILSSALTVDEASSGVFSNLATFDVDAIGDELLVDLSVSNGELGFTSGTTGLTLIDGDGSDGTLSFTGTETNINAALAGLEYTPDTGYSGADTLNIIVNDQGNNGSDPGLSGDTSSEEAVANVNITVNDLQFAPETDNVMAAGNEDATSIQITLSASDVDGSVASFRIITLPTNGNLFADAALTDQISANGVITEGANGAIEDQAIVFFVPDLNFNGSPNFTYAATDNEGNEDATPATATINVAAQNDAPTLGAGALGLTEDANFANFFLATIADDIDADNDGTNLTYTITNPPAEGTANIVSGTDRLVFDPGSDFQDLAAGESRDVTITVQAEDNGGLTASNDITVTITGLNDAPSSLDENGSLGTITELTDGDVNENNQVLSGSTAEIAFDDPDGGTPSLIVTPDMSNDPSFNIVFSTNFTDNGGTRDVLEFTPTINDSALDQLNAGQTVDLTFTLGIDDGNGGLTNAAAPFTVQLVGRNDAPTLDAGTLSATENGVVATLDLSTLGNDVDLENNSNNLLYTLDPQVFSEFFGNGVSIMGSTLEFDTGANFESLAAGETTDVSFDIIATDSQSATATNTITVTVTGTNDAPVAQADTNSGAEDNDITGQLLATDVDTNDTLTFSLDTATASLPVNGLVNIQSDGSYTYTPTSGFSGNDSFTYQVSDGNGGVDTATINLTVTPVNDAPIAGVGSNITISEDALTNISGLSVVDEDAGNAPITVTLSVTNGIILVSSSVPGGLGSGGISGNNSASVELTGTISDINATLIGTGGVRYLPLPDFNGSDTFTLAVDDGGATGAGGPLTDNNSFDITITPVNDRPLVSRGVAIETTAEDTPLEITGFSVAETDGPDELIDVTITVDNGLLAGTPLTGPDAATIANNNSASITVSGSVSEVNAFFASSGGLVFTPGANFNGTVNLNVLADDGALDDDFADTIQVTGLNDAPNLSDLNNATIPENTANAQGVTFDASVSLSDTDSVDFNGGNLTVAYSLTGFAEDTISIPTGTSASMGVVLDSNTVFVDGVAIGTLSSTDDGINGNNFVVNFDQSTGPTVAQAEALIEALQYSNSSDNPQATREISITVNDGDGGTSAPVTSTITVTAENDDPVISGSLTATVDEGGLIALAPSDIFGSDVDNIPADLDFTFTGGGPQNGTLLVNGVGQTQFNLDQITNGLVQYQHDGSETTTDSFAFALVDGDGGLTPGTFNFTVNPINDAPVITTTPISAASVVVNNAPLDDLNADGPDGIPTFNTFEDAGAANTVIPGISGFQAGDVVTFDITVGNQGGLRFVLTDGTSDIAGFAPVSLGGTGTNEIVSYVVTGAGDTTLGYRVDNVGFGGNPGWTINATVQSGGLGINEDTAGTFAGLSIADDDAGTDPVSVTLSVNDGELEFTNEIAASALTFSDPVGTDGTLAFTGTVSAINTALASLQYTPDLNFNGTDQLTITVNDQGNNGADPGLTGDAISEEALATVPIIVNAVNDAPETIAATASGSEDAPLITVLLDGSDDSDVGGTIAGYRILSLPNDGDLFTDAGLMNQISIGDTVPTAVGSSIPVFFVPDTNFNGTATFDFAAVDGEGLEDASPATATITVVPQNDPPNVSGPVTANATEDGSVATVNPLANASDLEGDALSVVNLPASLPDGVSFIPLPSDFGAPPAGLTFTDTTNVTLANAQIEVGADTSDNPNVVNAAVGSLVSFTPVGTFGVGGGVFGSANLDDGDIGAGVTSDGTYAITGDGATPGADPSLTLNFGSSTTVSSIAIYMGYANRDDGTFTLRDDGGNVLGEWTISTTGVGTNDGVHSFWLTFDTPVTTSSLQLDVVSTDATNTTSFREIQVFADDAPTTPQLVLDPTDPSFQDLAAGATRDVTVNYDVSDGTVTTSASTTFTVTGTNDAPTVDLDGDNSSAAGDGSAVTFTEGLGEIAIADSDTLVGDADDVNIESATITLTNPLDGALEGLAVFSSLPSSITPSFNASSTVVTLTGSASLADYQTAIESIRYNNTSDDPNPADRIINVVVNDGDVDSNIATATITVVPQNDAPMAVNTASASNEDADFIQVVLSGTDADGTIANFRVIDLPSNGTLSLDSAGTQPIAANDLVAATSNMVNVFFIPDPNFNGSPSFTFTAIDDQGLEDATPATATIVVDAVNDAPVINTDNVPQIGANFGGTTSDFVNIASTNNIPTGDITLSFWLNDAVNDNTTGGFPAETYLSYAVVGDDNEFFVSKNGDTQDISLTFNGNPNTIDTGVLVPTDGDWHNFTITYNATNGAVELFLDGASVFTGTTPNTGGVTPNGSFVLGQDQDNVGGGFGANQALNGDLAEVAIIDGVASAADIAALANGTYDPTEAEVYLRWNASTDEFSDISGSANVVNTNGAIVETEGPFLPASEDTPLIISGISVSDVDAGSADIEVTLAVTNGVFNVSETVSGGLGSTDVANNNTGSVTLTGTVAQINATLANAVGLTFFPTGNFNGTSTVTVTVDDLGATGSGGAQTNTASFDITVNSVNDAPLTNAASATGDEDAASIEVTLTGSDLEGGVADFRILSLSPNGTLYSDAGLTNALMANDTVAAGLDQATVFFVPNADFNGPATFAYAAIDANGLEDATPATATITVNAVNDAPTIEFASNNDLDGIVVNNANLPSASTTGNSSTIVLTNDGSGSFSSLNLSPDTNSTDVALGDFDSDGDLDAVIGLGGESRIAVNQGGQQGGTEGTFSNSQVLPGGIDATQGVAVGDIDRDGDLDIVLANWRNSVSEVLTNQGGAQAGTEGAFSATDLLGGDTGGPDGFRQSRDVALGDLDGDGDLDIIIANGQSANQLYINQGGAQNGTEGIFGNPSGLAEINQSNPTSGITDLSVVLGDLDGDGDLDAYIGKNNAQNEILINDGSAGFTAQIDGSGSFDTTQVSLGDLDGDGDLDAFVANKGQNNQVGINDGTGSFSFTTIEGSGSNSEDVTLADIDNDGDLDAIVSNNVFNTTPSQDNEIFLNDGAGNFTVSGTTLPGGATGAIVFGDLDGDAVFNLGENIVQNGGFENAPDGSGSGGVVVVNSGNSTTVPGWTVNSGSIDVVSNLSALGPVEGDRFIDLNGNNPGSISQTLNTQIGTTYHVSFLLSGDPDDGELPSNGFGNGQTDVTVSVDGQSQTFGFINPTGATRANPGSVEHTFSFTATQSATTLTFASADLADANSGPLIDDVQVREIGTEIPEDVPTILPSFVVGDVDAVDPLITLTANNGVLAFKSGADLTGITNISGAGTANFSFEGSVTDLNRVLDDSILFTPNSEFSGTAQVEFNINDQGETGTGGALSASETLFLNIVSTNDAPTLDLDGNNTSGATGSDYVGTFTEGDGPVNIGDGVGPGATSSISISDIDDTNIEGATFTITNVLDGANEFLVADLGIIQTTLGLTVSGNNTDTITITGTGTIAQYEQALENVRYNNTSSTPNTTDRIINVTVNDGDADSNVAVATISVVDANNAPVVSQIGQRITSSDGGSGDNFGDAVAVASDGTIIVSAPGDDNNSATDSGSVFVASANTTGGYNLTGAINGPDANASDFFGNDIAVNDAGRVVVGQQGYQNAENEDGAGRVVVYDINSSGGLDFAGILEVPQADSDANDNLGIAVDVNNNGVIVAGANGDDGAGNALTGSGAVYVYLDATSTTPFVLRAPDAASGDNFGASVAINDSGVIVVGATQGDQPNENSIEVSSGSAYVFTPIMSGGVITGYNAGVELLFTGDSLVFPGGGDNIGAAVAINNAGRIAVGAPNNEYGEGANSGVVVIFDSPTDTTPQFLRINESSLAGSSLALNDNGLLAVGAPGSGSTQDFARSVFLFQDNGSGTFNSFQTLSEPAGIDVSNFGESVALNNNGALVVGADLEDNSNGVDAGTIYTFVPNATNGQYTLSTSALPVQEGDTPSDTLVAVTGDIQAETAVESQITPRITELANGNYVVVWTVDTGFLDEDIVARVFDANGNPVSAEIPVSSGAGGHRSPAIATTDTGFVVAYLQETSGSNFDIRFRGFDNSGTENISEVIADDIVGVTGRPDINVLSNDQIVVVWRDSPSGNDIQGRVYNSNGTAVGSDFTLVNNPGDSGESSLIALSNGNFGLSYVDGSGDYAFQQFDASGNPPTATGSILQPFANTGSAGAAIELTNGNIVAVWESTGDGSGDSIQGAIFQLDGTIVQSEFTLNISTGGNQTQPSITALADGGFFVVYSSGDTSNSGVFGQRYDANGNAIGSEIRINDEVIGNQITNRDFGSQVVTQLTTGEIVVTFETGGADVFTRVFELPNSVPETVTIDLNNFFTATDSDPGDTPSIDQSSIVITAAAGNVVQSTTGFAVNGTQVTYDTSIFDFLDDGEQETFNIAFNIVSGTDTVARSIEVVIDGETDANINVSSGSTNASELVQGSSGTDDLIIASGFGVDGIGDELDGNGGNDIYLGDAGNNIIRTSDGDDIIYPGGGNAALGRDFIIGRLGNDQYIFSGITSGIVAITYAQLGLSVRFDIDAVANTGSADFFSGNNNTGNVVETDLFVDVQDIVNAGGLELFGSGGGGDTFDINSTSTGSIKIFGGSGSDIFDLQGGNITIDFGFDNNDGSTALAVLDANQGANVNLNTLTITNDGFGTADTFASGSVAPTEIRGTTVTFEGDVFVGTNNDETFVGRGGPDDIRAGGGNDTIVVPDLGFAFVDGGSGIDILELVGGGQNLDFTNLGTNEINSLEELSLGVGDGSTVVTLDEQNVIDFSETSDPFANLLDDDPSGNTGNPLVESAEVLVVTGDASDTLNLEDSGTQTGASWALEGVDQGFEVYNFADATTTFASVAVDEDVVVNVV